MLVGMAAFFVVWMAGDLGYPCGLWCGAGGGWFTSVRSRVRVPARPPQYTRPLLGSPGNG